MIRFDFEVDLEEEILRSFLQHIRDFEKAHPGKIDFTIPIDGQSESVRDTVFAICGPHPESKEPGHH